MTTASYPTPSSAAVTAVMRANRKTGTLPEVRLRSLLHRAGLRFRKNHAVMAGDVRVRPDIVFARARVAVFVDGCFWHGCPDHGTRPRTNADYWDPKLRRNAVRDRRANEALASAGWRVIRVWEHEDPDRAARQVLEAVRPA